jgi:predicted RNA-binding Zn ribbon-like protein
MHYADTYEGAGFGREFVWLDLANTIEWDGYGRMTDHLRDPAWLARILKHWNLSSRVPGPVPAQNLMALRTLLRGLAAKLHEGKSLNARDLHALNSYMNVAVRVQVFQRQNGVRTEIVPLRAGWPWILSRIAASFAEMLAMGRADRLKYCFNDGCKWIFYDQTKGNTRRWCNDKTCGNRDRVRRARARSKKSHHKS